MKKVFAIGAMLLASTAMFAQPQLSKDNIDEVLKAMTLEEKATLLVGSGWGSMTAGSMTASATALVPGAAGTTRAIERLGIPQYIKSFCKCFLCISTVLSDGLQPLPNLYIKFFLLCSHGLNLAFNINDSNALHHKTDCFTTLFMSYCNFSGNMKREQWKSSTTHLINSLY